MLRANLDDSLSGGPVTRILTDEEDGDLDPCPDDLEVNWVHPATARLNEAEDGVSTTTTPIPWSLERVLCKNCLLLASTVSINAGVIVMEREREKERSFFCV